MRDRAEDDGRNGSLDDDGAAAELDRRVGAFATVDGPDTTPSDTGGGMIIDVVLQEA